MASPEYCNTACALEKRSAIHAPAPRLRRRFCRMASPLAGFLQFANLAFNQVALESADV
jgi:hypothetical protein